MTRCGKESCAPLSFKPTAGDFSIKASSLQLFGAGREKRIYAVPPYTPVESLGFEDHPFEVQRWNAPCALCGATDTFLDEVITDDQGGRMHVCSDSDHCQERQAAQATTQEAVQ